MTVSLVKSCSSYLQRVCAWRYRLAGQALVRELGWVAEADLCQNGLQWRLCSGSLCKTGEHSRTGFGALNIPTSVLMFVTKMQALSCPGILLLLLHRKPALASKGCDQKLCWAPQQRTFSWWWYHSIALTALMKPSLKKASLKSIFRKKSLWCFLFFPMLFAFQEVLK